MSYYSDILPDLVLIKLFKIYLIAKKTVVGPFENLKYSNIVASLLMILWINYLGKPWREMADKIF